MFFFLIFYVTFFYVRLVNGHDRFKNDLEEGTVDRTEDKKHKNYGLSAVKFPLTLVPFYSPKRTYLKWSLRRAINPRNSDRKLTVTAQVHTTCLQSCGVC